MASQRQEDALRSLRPYDPNRDVRNWTSRRYDNREQDNHGYERDNYYYNDPYYSSPHYIYGNRQPESRPEVNRNYTRSQRPPQRHVLVEKSNSKSPACLAVIFLTIVALILVAALGVFLVIYITGMEGNNSTTVMSTQPTVTTQAPPTGLVTVDVFMKLMQPFLPAYNDILSSDYRQLESNFTNSMDDIFTMSDLRSSCDATNVNSFSPGSVNVCATLGFKERLLLDVIQTSSSNLSLGMLIQMKIEETIIMAVETGICCNEITINASTVKITQVTLPTRVPTSQATTRTPSTSTTSPPTMSVSSTTSIPKPDVTTEAVSPRTSAPQPDVTTAVDVVTTKSPADPVTTSRQEAMSTTTVPATTPEKIDETTTSAPSTTVEMTTTEPGMLNPPGCGVSMLSPPSPPDSPVTARGTWPWVGSVRFRTGHACGVTLLGEQWAVTSYTCVGDGGTLTSLVFGDITSSYSQSDVHIERSIETVRMHPGFNRVTFDNDVVLLRLAQPVVTSNAIRPVCFQRDEQVSSYQTCYIAGWGTLSGTLLENLMTAPISSIADGICSGSTLPLDLTDKYICAQFTDPDACIGDSGSGLMCQDQVSKTWSLVGILESPTDNCMMATFIKVSSYWEVASSVIDGTSEIPCDPIQVPQCTSVLPYSTTYSTTQSAITSHMSTAQSSGLLNCHSKANVVLCAALMPECKSDGNGLTICQQTCEEVSSVCATLFNQLSLVLDCRSFPRGADPSSGLCEKGADYSCGYRSLTLPAMYDYTTISSPNFPNPYTGLDDCIWIVTAPQDAYIIIKFLALNIESCCDTLTIGEGMDSENRTTVHMSVYGTNPPKPLVVTNHIAWLRFQSDSEEQVKGFQAEVQAVGTTGLASYCSRDSVSSCSDGISCIPFRWRCDDVMDCPLGVDENCQTLYEEITLSIDSSQQIKSPGYAMGSYVGNANNTWIIRTQPGRKLIINFDDFNTEQDYDVLEVGDGTDPSDGLFFFWSGDMMPPVILSDSNTMWIQFTSDKLINRRGFDLIVFDVESTVTFDCGSNQFDCGHSVCVPDVWQCDGVPRCADSSDEAGCVQVMAPGSMTLQTPFTSDLENKSSQEYLTLSNQFTSAIDPVLSNQLGTAYVKTTVNTFRSSDDPIQRVVTPPVTLVYFTIELNRFPSTNQTTMTAEETRALITNILTEEVADGTLGSVMVNASSVQINDVSAAGSTDTTTSAMTTQDVCFGNEFQCDEGLCIPTSSVCDQVSDCVDGTDEELGRDCPVACGESRINVTSQGSVNLTVPMVTQDNDPFFYKGCGYVVIAPANHRLYLVIHKISLVSDKQKLIIVLGQGKFIQYTSSVQQALDIVSLEESISITLIGDHWTTGDGISIEFSTTQQTDIAVCDNGVQVLPAEKRCNQHHDCLDYSDEFNCISSCGESNYTLDYNVSVPLQLTSYPSNYENNMACLWLFTGLPNASIIFDTYIINITAPDSLLFGKGHDPSVPLSTVAVLPGILPTGSYVVVSDSLAWAEFISDSEVTSGGFSVGVRVLYETDFQVCNNLVQAVFQEDICDGIAQCIGDPTDEVDCDKCQEIPVANCSRLLPYTKTVLPNRYVHNVSHAMTLYLESKDSFCQSLSEMVICSLFFPECPVDGTSRNAVCRSVCEDALNSCNYSPGICDSLPSSGGELWCNYEDDILETGVCGTRPAVTNSFARIVNGNDAALGNWPWMLSILDEDFVHRCGATLISDQWAITAAHCMGIINHAVGGFTNLDSPQPGYQLRSISQVYNHPFYDSVTNDNDISLIKLDYPVNFTNNIGPACLEINQNETAAYDKCYIAGWGALAENGLTYDILQEVRIPLVPKDQCIEDLQDIFTITDNMICAGYEDGRSDACQGDSGGPLVCEGPDGRWRLVGATSFGYGCAQPGRPGVYARISQYIDFIKYNIEADSKM